MADKWDPIRKQFDLSPRLSHFASLVFASHPTPVSNAIQFYRHILDVDGFRYFMKESPGRKMDAIEAAARYFDTDPGLVALTTGTTMGLAQVLGGIRMAAHQRVLISRNEHPAIVDTLKLRARREEVPLEPEPFDRVALFKDSRTASVKEIIENLEHAIKPETRVLALTWVYSCDGVKLPVAEIAELVAKINTAERRSDADRLLLVIDGVHGFGVENATFAGLGCDLFVAGCHKMIFAPRGSGVIYGRKDAWAHVIPFVALLAGAGGADHPAWDHIPGGVRAYEHQWAIAAAFDYHMDVLVKADVERRVRDLAHQFSALVACIPGVTVVTPRSARLSSGLVCLDVENYTAAAVVRELEADGVIVSTSAPDPTRDTTHVRFALSILNTDEDLDRALTSLRRL